jgi:hypothetical protein
VRQSNYHVLVGLIYLVGQCPNEVLDMTLPGGFGTRHVPLVWNVAETDASKAMEEFAPGLTTWGILFWVPLMRGGDDPTIIARWKELMQSLTNRHHRDELLEIALVFAELAGCYLAWEKGLEEVMTESAVVNRWLEQGENKGELKTKRADVLFALGKRFPGKVTDEIRSVINSQDSIELLQHWHEAAFDASSIEDFIRALRN